MPLRWRVVRLRSKLELAALAALAYLPFLASSPGRVSADSKQALYLDPARFLSRAADLWDPHVGAGSVPHQSLGYLFPTGPWFWAWDRLGAPDWVAQRLWLGTISLAAVLGARWLFTQLGTGRAGALAGAVVYMLTPYQLAFTARMSVLLLPWAALPWLVGLTMRATRSRGWRAPALFALALLAAGGINASSLLFVGVAPLIWVITEVRGGGEHARAALRGAAKVGALALGISMWWLAGVRVQGTYGLPVLQLTENLRTVAQDSLPSDVLRGLGNWFFYGRDRLGYSVDQAGDYAGASGIVVALSYGIPVVALGVAFLLRWSYRRYFCLLIVVGTVLAVGSWPYDAPSLFGTTWKAFVNNTSFGLALRNSPRIVPLIVLGFAGLVAGSVGAIEVRRWRIPAAAAAVTLAAAALLPVWQQGYLTRGVQRPEEILGYWRAAARAMDEGDHSTRVLEVPGSAFAAYRWGTTIDPITPELIERPYLAREVLPSGTLGTVNLLEALDRRMQLGTIEPASVAPIARLFGVGTIVLRGDLDQSGRFDTPEPSSTWAALVGAPGLGAPRSFGPVGGDAGKSAIPSVGLFDVQRAQAIVRVTSPHDAVVLAGDGDGLVDAAAAGLIDGSSLVLESAALPDAVLQRTLADGAHLILTDSNRKRSQTWFYALRDTRGETEPVGVTAPDQTGYDFRLDPFPGSTDSARSVVEQVGGRVTASAAGGPERPEDRAAHAVDGNGATAWRVPATDAQGASIEIVPDVPLRTDAVTLVQAPSEGPSLQRVRVEVAGNEPVEVDLGPASLQRSGQRVPVPSGIVASLRITLLTTTAEPGDRARVGLGEIGLGGFHVGETVRLPTDLLERSGATSARHGLDVVLTRLRVDLPGSDRRDDEAQIDRRVVLATPRSFALTGTGRLHQRTDPSDHGATSCRDDLLAIDGQPVSVRLTKHGSALSIVGCTPLVLTAGTHRVAATTGAATGIDLDRIILASGPDGQPADIEVRGSTGPTGSRITAVRDTSTQLGVDVRADGQPFWLVLGQSASDGWNLTVDGAEVGPRVMVDGYANGWRITPKRPGPLSLGLRWEPQRVVTAGLAVSAAVVVLCLVIVLVARRRRRRGSHVERGELSLAAAPQLLRDGDLTPDGWRSSARGAGLAGLLGLGVASPLLALLAGAIVVLGSVLRRGPVVLALVASGSLVASRMLLRPSLAWVAVLLLAASVIGGTDPRERQSSG